MAKRTVSEIRNVTVVGHGGSGKTTFVDHLLHVAGAVNRAGSVEAGTSLSDHDPEEKERKFSIESAIFNFQSEGKTFNLIDTPGYLDFSGAALAAIPAVETVVIVVSAPDGVQLNTRRMWEAAGKAGVARILLISHLDAENVQFDRLLAEIRDSFGNECVQVFMPVGLGGGCTGVVNLLSATEAPEGVVGDFESLKNSLQESIIECDDELMERYLEGEEIEGEKIEATFKQAIAQGKIVPILCCVAQN